jgi:hypothetical protein
MRTNWRTVALASLSALTVISAAHRHRSGGEIHSASRGKFSLQEIARRTDDFCRAIDVRVDKRTIVPCQTRAFRPDGTVQHIWRMDFMDAAGRNQACMNWDADTGELMYVSRQARRTAGEQVHAIQRSEADQLARLWMGKTGIARRGRVWSQVGTPKRTKFEWRSHWRSGDWMVTLHIDSSTGDLMLARAWRLIGRPLRAAA